MSNSFIAEAFNAKHLKDEFIAKSFVPSQLFFQTAKYGHTILVGPRGSGKTTFLRMLSNSMGPHLKTNYLLESLEHTHYEGIYVPGDLVWGEMMRSLSEAGIDQQTAESFAYSAFVTHILLNVIESIDVYINRIQSTKFDINEDDFFYSLSSICKLLKLKPEKVSLSRIKSELILVLSSLGEYSRFLSIYGTEKFSKEEFEKKALYAYIDLPMTLDSIFNFIDDALNRKEQRWTILLDEFEIAPTYLLLKVLNSMRSSAKKVTFKVALVPCGLHQEVQNEISSINDYTVVELWYIRKGDSDKFCRGLLRSRFNITFPEKKLGMAKYGITQSGNADKWINAFDELYSKDLSFKKYIDGKKLDYRKELTEGRASSTVRKIAPLVAFRNAFINQKGKRKGRKAPTEFYSGWDAISTISEGNPRWLLSVMSPFAESENKIRDTEQIREVKRSTSSYCAMLKTLPICNNMGLNTKQPVFKLLEQIGTYFNYCLIEGDFKVSPPGTFKVDKNIPEDMQSALMIAWNFGAIVSVESSITFGTYSSLEGMRFRLSHLLSPEFELNLATGKAVNLSTILDFETNAKKRMTTAQGDLF
ncbi:hypothetical protein CWB99_23090 [Pseudoalteromonas rubra]|uniref:Uncharacterized protein n=1 Tax=Pseudoalteromonas rubra TaxID=43658 RepID=A0A5S3WFV4_9GAMM|nr:ATP-binding protein [Pseudoalteromonas rubra]TMP23749.1 hypothetical protein CWB99_23090 [Pseudoalteromonas rubra]TMP27246.1 hypothetical protein CWC00_23425 [Pseudoalteromonas rubra]